jgi:hypothetical protein
MAQHAVVGQHDGAARASSPRAGLELHSAGRWVVAITAVAVACLVVGGYGMGWRWTGLSRAVTLWDWLQALLLPIALGLTPVLLLHRNRLRPVHAGLIGAGVGLFGVLVVAGYLVPLAWTGFAGHTLWDWFELALLPLVVTAAPIWVKADRLRREHLLLGALGGLAFGAFVLAGYAVPLGWTGFSDNTAWDWLKLLLLPVLLPTVVIPLLSAMMQRSLADIPPDPIGAPLPGSDEGAVRG